MLIVVVQKNSSALPPVPQREWLLQLNYIQFASPRPNFLLFSAKCLDSLPNVCRIYDILKFSKLDENYIKKMIQLQNVLISNNVWFMYIFDIVSLAHNVSFWDKNILYPQKLQQSPGKRWRVSAEGLLTFTKLHFNWYIGIVFC